MRLAFDTSTEVGGRAARVLLAERTVERLDSLHHEPNTDRRRTGVVGDLNTYDVVVSDGRTRHADVVARASVHGIPVVLWSDEPSLHRGPATTPVLVGANLGSLLAPSLAHHPVVGLSPDDDVTIAWTEPGKALRKGVAVPFPDPVGVMWAKRRAGGLVANRDDEWAGASATVRGPSGERVVGVADHAAHLEAVILAAAAYAAATEDLEPAIVDAATYAEPILRRALDMELDVAVWRSTSI